MPTPAVIKARQDAAFAHLQAAAIAGKRCPTSDELLTLGILGVTTAVLAIARLGRIRIEVYAHNWRVVEILEGPNKGARTAPRPNDSRQPWQVIDGEGKRTRRGGGLADADAARRTQPSKPRVLSSEEL